MESEGAELLAVVRDNDGWNAKFGHVVVFQRRNNRGRALVRQRVHYDKSYTSISNGENVPEPRGSIQRSY